MKDHKDFYKGKTLQNERTHRNRVNVELRNERRDEIIARRRILLNGVKSENNSIDISMMLNKISSTNIDDVFIATESLRKSLNSDQVQLYEQVLSLGLIDHLINHLSSQHQGVQLNCTIILSNLADASPNCVPYLIKMDVLPTLINMIDTVDNVLLDAIMQALINIMDRSNKFSAFVRSDNLLSRLFNLLVNDFEINLKATALNLLTILVRDGIILKLLSPNLLQIIELFKKLMELNDIRLMASCIWILAAFCDNSDRNAELIIKDEFILKGILKLAKSNNIPKIINPIIRLFGNISAGSDEKTQAIIDIGALDILSQFKDMEGRIKKEFLWFISNIAAGTYEQSKLISKAGLCDFVFNCFVNGSLAIRKEALWVISNLLYNANSDDVLYWINCNFIQILAQLLSQNPDNEIIKLIIECFNFMLQNCPDEKTNIKNQIETHGALDSMQELLDFPSITEEIFSMIDEILENFFPETISADFPDYANDVSFDF